MRTFCLNIRELVFEVHFTYKQLPTVHRGTEILCLWLYVIFVVITVIFYVCDVPCPFLFVSSLCDHFLFLCWFIWRVEELMNKLIIFFYSKKDFLVIPFVGQNEKTNLGCFLFARDIQLWSLISRSKSYRNLWTINRLLMSLIFYLCEQTI